MTRLPEVFLDKLAQEVMQVCGPGPLQVIEPSGAILRRLRLAGCLAAPLDAADPGGVERDAFVVAVDLPGMADPDEARAFLSAVAARGRGSLLAMDTRVGGGRAPTSRAWWEELAFGCGLRRHPMYFDVVDYGHLDAEPRLTLIPLQALAPAAFERDPDPVVSGIRDAARTPGREAEARLIRYAMAASLARPGDAVLDLCCGLGEGSHVLRNAASVATVTALDADPDALAYARLHYGEAAIGFELGGIEGVADDSCDLVVCLDRRAGGVRELARQARRVLRPGGRLLVGVACSESAEGAMGKGRLVREVAASLKVEGAWAVDAGGVHRPGARRRILPVAADDQADGEFVVVVCMRDPVGAAVTFADTIYPSAGGARNLVAFARDYANPWLMRSMFGISVRALDAGLRGDMARRTIAAARPGGADHGAAVGVMGYAALASGGAAAWEVALGQVAGFLAHAQPTPHALRWKVSLLFLRGRLLLALGRDREAEEALLACQGEDWLSFSPTLGTKVVEAAWLVGRMRQARGDLAGARDAWRGGLAAAVRAMHAPEGELIGSPEIPLPDTLAEMGELLDLAQRCSLALSGSAQGRFSPLRTWAFSARNRAWEGGRAAVADGIERERLEHRLDRIIGGGIGRALRRSFQEVRKLRSRLAPRGA